MESNKQEPDSLRVVGAFTVGAARIYLDTIELQSETPDYLESIFYENIEKIMSSLDDLSEEKYIEYLYTGKYVDEFSKILVAIHQLHLLHLQFCHLKELFMQSWQQFLLREH